MFRRMRIRAFDLDKAFRADGLIAASCMVQIWRVVKEADGTFSRILVEISLNGLPVDERIARELFLSWS